MSPKDKAAELLSEFSAEKALDIIETFQQVAIHSKCETDCIYWQDVINEIEPPSYFKDL